MQRRHRAACALATIRRLFVGPLNALGARYAVTGAMAIAAYGEPRLTNDLDVIVDCPATRAEAFHDAFAGEGLYVPDVESLGVEFARERGGHFTMILDAAGLRDAWRGVLLASGT